MPALRRVPVAALLALAALLHAAGAARRPSPFAPGVVLDVTLANFDEEVRCNGR